LIQPLGTRVLVKPLSAEDRSEGGIILPDSAQKKPQEGKVIAVGTGRVLEDGSVRPLTVKKGDVVIYPEYGGTEIKISGEEYLLVDEDSILAVREPEKKAAARKPAARKSKKKK
jgi:chaperonin GroES